MTQITILNQNNEPQGPFTRSEVAQRLHSGQFTLGSLAFIDGLSQWTPLRDVLAKVDAVTPVLPATPPVITPPATQPYSYAATMQPPPHLEFAGFWLRFVAIFIDGLILSPLAIVSFMLQHFINDSENSAAQVVGGLLLIGYSLIALLLRWIYFALMESSAWQATLGKKVVGIRVTGIDGQRIGFGRATGRYFGKLISLIPIGIGFMMAGWTERKQALHDMIAGTLVVKG